MLTRYKALITLLIFPAAVSAQILTAEDSLTAGLNPLTNNKIILSGYGEARYTQNFASKKAEANLTRAVLFLGYRFNEKLTLFTETEFEDAKIDADGGEVALEQAYIKFDVTRNTHIDAGLFIPRIGIINENHLPTTFCSNDRPVVETYVIPSTWREIGINLNGNFKNLSSLNFSVAILNGLNAEEFNLDKGIREGRYEGREASARNKAVTASLLYYAGNLRVQASMYYGGSFGEDDKTADRLDLSTGFFGTPVWLNELNVQYRYKGISLKALAAVINIPDADKINAAFANNTPEQIFGTYGEIGYDVLHSFRKEKKLIVFGRYEYVDMNNKIPDNGVENEFFTQNHVFAGLAFLPASGVIVKADYHFVSTGAYNSLLIVNPDPYAAELKTTQNYFNLGIGYSF